MAENSVPVPPYAPDVPRARSGFVPADTDVPPVFVGLSISGGGSRAAVFGIAVMEKLDQIGILQNVSAISTTSGGGLAGAYYATRDGELDWEIAKKDMATNFLQKWLLKSLLPQNALSVAFSHEDRSDLMADVFDDALFHGATYAKLGNFSMGRKPVWLANATDAYTGQRFTFSHDEFMKLNSSLASFPISQAVMTSAAFPGVFSTVTLKNYLPVRQTPQGLSSPLVAYKHLIDGGPADNLGIESLLEMATLHRRALLARDAKVADNRCLLLIADAYPSGVPSRKMWDPDPRTWYDHIVDSNFLGAFDALLVRRRSDLLGYAGIKEAQKRLVPHQFVQFDVPIEGGWRDFGNVRRVGGLTPLQMEQRLRSGQTFRLPPVPEGYFRCAAWHINLNGIEEVTRYSLDPQTGLPEHIVGDARGEHPLMKHRSNLHSVVSQIDTNFQLSGPRNCSASFLAKSIDAASSVLVTEDYENQVRACQWMKEAGLQVKPSCGVLPGNPSMALVKLDNLESDAPRLPTGRPMYESVRCK